MNIFSSITWAAEKQLPLVIILFVLITLLLLYRLYRLNHVAKVLVAHSYARQFLVGYSFRKNSIKSVLFLLGTLFLGAALLRPQWGKTEQVVKQNGRDLLVALDISRSMCTQDCPPNRLTVAKEKIKQLLSLLSCERVGLLLFSGTCFVQCPLTNDYDAFKMFLDLVDVETIASGTTALDQVVKQALTIYKEMPQRKNKLLVVFTDGEDFSSNLTGLKTEASAIGMHIFTVGIGTQEGAPIPLFDEQGRSVGHQKDRQGNVVISRVNEGILESLARDVGGIYVPITHDMKDMQRIVNAVQAFEKEQLDDKKIQSLQDRFHYFLAAATACFILEWML